MHHFGFFWVFYASLCVLMHHYVHFGPFGPYRSLCVFMETYVSL